MKRTELFIIKEEGTLRIRTEVLEMEKIGLLEVAINVIKRVILLKTVLKKIKHRIINLTDSEDTITVSKTVITISKERRECITLLLVETISFQVGVKTISVADL